MRISPESSSPIPEFPHEHSKKVTVYPDDIKQHIHKLNDALLEAYGYGHGGFGSLKIPDKLMNELKDAVESLYGDRLKMDPEDRKLVEKIHNYMAELENPRPGIDRDQIIENMQKALREIHNR